MKKIIFTVALGFLGGFAAISLNNYFFKSQNSTLFLTNQQTPARFTANQTTAASALDFTQAAEATINAVVHVKNTIDTRKSANGNDPLFDFFFGNPHRGNPNQQSESSGSGVIISDDGYIVTNNHVIDNASKINIVLNDKREYEAKLIGKDPNTDLALLKIEAKKLPFVTYGNSDGVKIGEWALAVGNPFNLTSTVTAGIISAKGRNINILNQKYAIESFLQTDAAVNPGNSGGALVNTNGELIGINSAIASNTGSFTGYSFAIPVNIVKKVVADLLEYGEVQRAFIGITLSDLNANLAKEKKIEHIEGVYVAGLGETSAAAEGGVKEGDVILGVNDVRVNNIPELQEQVGRYRPGDKVTLKIRRGNDDKNIPVVLKNRNGDTKLFKASETVLLDLGADFLDVPEMEMQKLNIRNGIKVTKLRSGKLKSVGIKEGFIITHIGDKPVNNVEELSNLMRGERKGYLIEGIYPNGTKAYYGLGI